MTADLTSSIQVQLAKDAELAAWWAAHRRAYQKPPFRPNREELAWAAGFFDGEGTTQVSRNFPAKNGVTTGPYLRIHLAVDQVGEWCLIRFRQAVGGLGAIYVLKPRGNRSECHRWQVGSFEGAQAVIAMLGPFWTSPKQAQAAACLQAMRDYHQRKADKNAPPDGDA